MKLFTLFYIYFKLIESETKTFYNIYSKITGLIYLL
jgi:hypothetical protein